MICYRLAMDDVEAAPAFPLCCLEPLEDVEKGHWRSGIRLGAVIKLAQNGFWRPAGVSLAASQDAGFCARRFIGFFLCHGGEVDIGGATLLARVTVGM